MLTRRTWFGALAAAVVAMVWPGKRAPTRRFNSDSEYPLCDIGEFTRMESVGDYACTRVENGERLDFVIHDEAGYIEGLSKHAWPDGPGRRAFREFLLRGP